MRRPGGAVAPAMNPATGFLQFCLIHSAASSSALPPISPIMMMPVRLRVGVEKFDDIQMRRAVHRIATDANAGGLADAARGELPHRFVGQRAAARDHADVSFFVNVSGRDADAASAVRILAFAGRDDAGTIRADEPRLEVALHRAFHPHHVAHRNAFGDGDDQFQSGVRAFENRIGGERRRHKHRAGGRAGLFDGFGDGVENRNLFPAVLKNLTAFAGGDAGDDLRAVINRELRVLAPKLPVMPWMRTLVSGLTRMDMVKFEDLRSAGCDSK